MPLTSKEMIRLLKQNGFVEKGQTGSHIKLVNPKTKISVIVPMHSKELKIGLEKAILKQARISEDIK